MFVLLNDVIFDINSAHHHMYSSINGEPKKSMHAGSRLIIILEDILAETSLITFAHQATFEKFTNEYLQRCEVVTRYG